MAWLAKRYDVEGRTSLAGGQLSISLSTKSPFDNEGDGHYCRRTYKRMAHAFARLERLDGGRRIADAMRLHPALIGGTGQLDSQLMTAFPGLVAKGGAEGLLCLVTAGGIGIALKSRDGNPRPHRTAINLVFERLGVGELPESLLQSHVRNSRNEISGSLSGNWPEPV